MNHVFKTTLAAAIAAAGVAFIVPASAGPFSSQGAGLSAAAGDNLINVQQRRRYRENDWAQESWGGQGYGWGRDTVGSLGYDGRGYAFNRFSGARYNTCQEDLGYGRVRPCDAGQR